jgi:4-amino-4-deoxy-L-arabinose transferase-like glycosyltransferase
MRTHHADALVTCVCVALVALAVPVRPFWLDEVLQLVATRPEYSTTEVIARVSENPGSAPLGYLVQHLSLNLLGVSRWSARLPAALFAAASCVATLHLARRLGVSKAWLAALILCCLPLSLRYAAEARPYSQAVFISTAATVLFLRLAERSTPWRWTAYVATLVAGVYTLPFTVLVAGGHVLWAASARRWRLAASAGIAAFGAAAAFLPWMVYAREGWKETMVVSRFEFVADWRTPFMLVREISGAGYVGAGLLLVLAVTGIRSLPKKTVALLAGSVAASFAGGLLADAALGYFVAVRQFICVLPALAILAARRPVPVLVASLLALSAWKNWQYFTHATEDWESATVAIQSELHSGRCLLVQPERELRVYAALAPLLSLARCTGLAPEMVVAVSPYGDHNGLAVLPSYTVTSERSVGGTRLLIIRR